MVEDKECATDAWRPPAANDNGDGGVSPRINAAALRIARLIGRQIAREEFERLSAANDNRPRDRCDD